MLTYLRKHSKGMLAYVAFGAIIFVFVLWGGSSYLSREANKIAKVDRRIISVEQYSKAYTDTLKRYQRQFQGALTPELIDKLDLRRRVLEDLVDQYIIETDAKALGIVIKDDDLRYFISQVGAFQKDGAFDETLYRRYLESEGLTPAQFEERARKDFIRKLFSSIVTENVIITREEIEAAYHLMNDAYELKYLVVKGDAYLDSAQVGPQDLARFYDANKERYRIPAKVALAYIDFATDRFLGQAEVTEQDARDYYDLHKEEFSEPPSVLTRQIILKVPEGSGTNVVEQKRELAQRIIKEAQDPKADFASLARAYSEDASSASRGGDMGMVPLTELPREVADAVRGKKAGEVVGPVIMQDGIRVVKIEEMKEGKLRPFEDVSSELMARLKAQRARIIAKDEAQKAFTELYEQRSPDLDAYARARSLEVKKVGPLTEAELSSVMIKPEDAKKAFAFQEGELGDVVETSAGYAVYKVARKELSRIPDLKEVEERVASDARAKKALEMARAQAQRLAASGEDRLDAMKPSITPAFTRSASEVPGLEQVEGITDHLDSLDKPKVFETGSAVYIVWLGARKVADIRALDTQTASKIREELLSIRREQVMDDYLKMARDDKLGWHKVYVDASKVEAGRKKASGDTPPPEGFN